MSVIFLDPERLRVTDDVSPDSLLLDRSHVIIKLSRMALAETPERIDLAVVINEDARIESELSLNGISERTPRAFRSHEHDRRTPVLRSIHIESIALLDNVGCIKIAPVRSRVADTVACPVREVIHGRRPYNIIGSAVVSLLGIVRSVKINAGLAVISKYSRLAIGNVLPKRHVRIRACNYSFLVHGIPLLIRYLMLQH